MQSNPPYLRAFDLCCLSLFAFCLGGSLFFTGTEGLLFLGTQIGLWGLLSLRFLLVPVSLQSFSPVWIGSLGSLYLLWMLSLLWTPVPAYSQMMYLRLCAVPMVLVLVAGFPSTYWPVFRGVVALSLLGLVGWALWQYLGGESPRASFLNKNSLAGYLILGTFLVGGGTRRSFWCWGTPLVLLGTGVLIGVIGSRGAFLGLGFGLVIVFFLALRRRIGFRELSWRSVPLAAGLLISLPITRGVGEGVARLVKLSDPVHAGNDRVMIWMSSLEMLQAKWLTGWGLGVYGLAYPPFRKMGDKSVGHFAHNDPLQIWIESGLPGILLAGATAVLFLVWALGSLRSERLEARGREELCWLLAGLAAVSLHSLVTFHLYVYGILVLAGLVLARCLQTVSPEPDTGHVNSRRSPLLGWLCCVPLVLVLFQTGAQWKTEQAIDAIRDNQPDRAIVLLETARRFWPSNDFNWYMDGEIHRQALDVPGLTPEVKQEFRQRSERMLLEALSRNPFRSMTAFRLGQLKETTGENGPSALPEDVIQWYAKALEINPRNLSARLALARYHRRQSSPDQARAVLEEGVDWYYPDSWELPGYLGTLMVSRRAQGDVEGALQLEKRIQSLMERRQQKMKRDG